MEPDDRLRPERPAHAPSARATSIADRAVQIHGGLGYMREVPVERFYRDARLFRLYEGTGEIQKLIIARQMVKEFQG